MVEAGDRVKIQGAYDRMGKKEMVTLQCCVDYGLQKAKLSLAVRDRERLISSVSFGAEQLVEIQSARPCHATVPAILRSSRST